MSTIYARLLLAWLTLSSLACAEHEIAVGEAIGALDLSNCYGEQTKCAGRAELERQILEDTGRVVACESGAETVMRSLAWEVRTESAWPQVAIADDGTLWMAGHAAAGTLRESVFVDRFDRSGERLVANELRPVKGHDVASYIVSSLVLDARGHVFLLIEASVADRARGWTMFVSHLLLELDPDGEQVGEPLEIEGLRTDKRPLLAMGSDGSLTLSAASSEGAPVLARLRADRTLAWVQNDTTQRGVDQLAVDAAGYVFASGRIQDQPESLYLNESLIRYDRSGNAVWEIQTGLFDAALSLVADGAVLFGIARRTDGFGLNPVLIKLDSERNATWSFQVPVEPLQDGLEAAERFPAWVEDDYTYFFSGAAEHGITAVALNRVNPEGTACARTALIVGQAPISPFAALDGAIYGLTEIAGLGIRVALFE